MLNEDNFVISLEEDEDDSISRPPPQPSSTRKRVIGRIEQQRRQQQQQLQQPQKRLYRTQESRDETQTTLDLESPAESLECTTFPESPELSKRKKKHRDKSQSRKKKMKRPPLLHRPIIERMGIPLVKFRTSANKHSQSISRYRRSVKLITGKIVKADKTWVGVMITLGTIDMVLNVANFAQLTDSNLQYCLVIGPPRTFLWQLLLAFTVVSWFLYVFESLNSFSLLYSPSRETYLPIPYDLMITLTFKHIPLSTIAYFISKSRRDYTTGIESICNAFRIIYILTRIIWFAHIEGRKIRKNDKYVIQSTFIFVCCLLFCVATSFAVQNWRKEPTMKLMRYHLINVSIVMLHENTVLNYTSEDKFPPERLKFNFSVKTLLYDHGYDIENPWLVRSLLIITTNNGSYGSYNCNRTINTPELDECQQADHLIFHFMYRVPSFVSPYGEINYNYAKFKMTTQQKSGENDASNDKKHECTDASEQILNGYQLYYLEFSRAVDKNGTSEVFVTAPFRKSWTHPRPRYNPEITVCDKADKFYHQLFKKFKVTKKKKNIGKTIYFPGENY
ncbi:hypothetical protein HELRODRAFT_194052 [Helobdella robusta]|uniref:Uncharacterized protein n=1 Tax=Helobdella robusta TaxID=6412 RepID=T1FVM3_HELRO|nr:hypothetical protein HELRODRAFT_194052 [Helobdella robusta]ESN93527.1 hypothetical protein HELRODRAFT_194052 [Helobdella robusta]